MATSELPRDDLVVYLRKLEARIAIIEQRSPLANTGLSVPGVGVTQVDGALNVSGAATVSGTGGIQSSNYVAGVSGWRFDGVALEANTGLVGDGALANPIMMGRIRASATNYALPFNSWGTPASVNVTVPADKTRLIAIVQGYTFTRNVNTTGGSSAGGDITYAYIGFGGFSSDSVGWPLSGSGGFTGAFAGDVFTFSGLTAGSTLTLGMNVATGYQPIPADPSTRCAVSAGLFWLR